MNYSTRRAFTLVELLVVVSIIAVLMALLIPTINTMRQASWKVVCQSNARQMTVGFLAYSADWRGMMMTPWDPNTGVDAGWHARLARYVNNGTVTIYVCPANKEARPDDQQNTQLVPLEDSWVERTRRSDFGINVTSGDHWMDGNWRAEWINGNKDWMKNDAPTWMGGTWDNSQEQWGTCGSMRLAAMAGDTAMFLETSDRPWNVSAFNGGTNSFAWGWARLQGQHRGLNTIGRVDGSVAQLTGTEIYGHAPWGHYGGAWTPAGDD